MLHLDIILSCVILYHHLAIHDFVSPIFTFIILFHHLFSYNFVSSFYSSWFYFIIYLPTIFSLFCPSCPMLEIVVYFNIFGDHSRQKFGSHSLPASEDMVWGWSILAFTACVLEWITTKRGCTNYGFVSQIFLWTYFLLGDNHIKFNKRLLCYLS